MKRIDDKIKEIEKKDKNNRALYIIIVLLIAAFMAYALSSEKKMKEQGEVIVEQGSTIEQQGSTIEQQLIDLQAKNKELEETIARLETSQTPIGFWNETMDAKNASSYINYILHTGKPETKEEYKTLALENIGKNETQGNSVWLFVGRTNGERIISDRVSELIYRHGEEISSVDVLPVTGDLLKNTTMNRNTYRRFSSGNVAGPNNADKAWKKGSIAQVLDVKRAGNAVFLKIKF